MFIEGVEKLFVGREASPDAAPAPHAAVAPLENTSKLRPWEDKDIPVEQRIDAGQEFVQGELEKIESAYTSIGVKGLSQRELRFLVRHYDLTCGKAPSQEPESEGGLP